MASCNSWQYLGKILAKISQDLTMISMEGRSGRLMSTSILLLDQNFNANNVDIMVFEPSVLPPPLAVVGGGVDDVGQNFPQVTKFGPRIQCIFAKQVDSLCFICQVTVNLINPFCRKFGKGIVTAKNGEGIRRARLFTNINKH